MAAEVVRLARFPIKACAPEILGQVEVGVAGVRHDRLLAVVVDGRIVTQREHAVLATVRPVLDDDALVLRVSAGPDGEPGEVEHGVTLEGAPRTVTLFGEPVDVVGQHPAFDAWFSELLGTAAQLVAAPDTTRRASPGAVRGETVLSDEGTLSLHSVASLDLLNDTLRRRGEPPVRAERFRANIVVDGCQAHAEDDTDRFEIGDTVLRFAQPDARCVVTTVDQSAGRRSGPEPIRTLAGYRRAATGGGVLFGIYLAVESGGLITLGDTVSMDGS